MRLAINIGNTNSAFGLWQEGLFSRMGKVTTHPISTLPKRFLAEFEGVFRQAQIEKVGLASVVPEADSGLIAALEGSAVGSIHQLSGIKRCGMEIRYKSPDTLGSDRIAGVLGALQQGPGPFVVVDFGTATTINAYDEAFLGGAILPGGRTAAEALLRKTALLPEFDLQLPPSTIGANTAECLQVGTVLGHAKAVDGLVRAMSSELRSKPQVLATGGLATTFARHCRTIDTTEPNLVLRGIVRFLDCTEGDSR